MEKENNAVLQRYVNLLSNSGFKAVFGDRANKDVVMSVMNMLLPEGKRVSDILYAPTEHQGQLEGNKEFRYDFMCRGTDGSFFIVEMQNSPEKFWFKRCVSYASRAYERQNKKGEDYDAVQPVYLIGLMGVPIDHPDKEFWKDRYVSEYTFREKDSHDLLDETIVIIFAELASFDKSEEECTTRRDRMLYILKNSSKLLSPPAWSGQESYTGILDACYIDDFDEEKRKKYDRTMQDEKRLRGQIAAAREMGEAAGLARGREEGREEANTEAARKFKLLGVDVEIIAQATGLAVEDIREL